MDPERAAEDDDHHPWFDAGEPGRCRPGTVADDLAEVVAVDTVREHFLQQQPNGVAEDDARVLGVGKQEAVAGVVERGRVAGLRGRGRVGRRRGDRPRGRWQFAERGPGCGCRAGNATSTVPGSGGGHVLVPLQQTLGPH